MKTAAVEQLLREEIAEVVGCTEPGAIAHAVCCARRYLVETPDTRSLIVMLRLSPEILRNASTAVVPGINRKGIKAAVVAGFLSRAEGFNPFSDHALPHSHPLLTRRSWLTIVPAKQHGIFLRARISIPGENVTVAINGRHHHVACVKRNGKILYKAPYLRLPQLKGLEEIKRIASRRNPRLESLARDFINRQVKGDSSLPMPERVAALVKDRMKGAPLPVMTITGSGNQGIFLALPLREWYEREGDQVLPAVLFALLTQIHVTRLRKRISAECGLATKAAPALAAGLLYARGKTLPAIRRAMRVVSSSMGSIPCHGAEPACGRKATRVMNVLQEQLSIVRQVEGSKNP